MTKKVGRPSLYKSSYPAELIKLMADGALDCQIFSKWDISKDTFYRWINEYPEFKEAHNIGIPKCESWWIEWGQKGMRGEIKGFSFNSWIAFMNNKFKWAKNALSEQASTTNNYQIGTMNVLNQMTRDDLIKDIQSLGTKLEEVIDVKFIESKSE